MADSGVMATGGGLIGYWKPDRRLDGYVSGYHRYVTSPPPGRPLRDVFYPGWVNLRFTIPGGDRWAVQLGRRRFDPVPAAALFGPSSCAGYVEAGAATMVGIGLTPMGWARLFGGNAATIANRILPIETALPAASALATIVSSASPAAALDAWFLDRLASRPAEPPEIAALFALIDDPAIDQVGTLLDRLGLDRRRLVMLSQRHFGFTPKLLLRRARFLRALVIVDRVDRGHWAAAARDAGYFDGSHFLRDCHQFLDRTLGAFVALDKPLNRAAARLRAQIIGAPMQALVTPEAIAPRSPAPPTLHSSP